MQTLLDQQQQLTLQTNQQIQHLQLEKTKETEKKLEAFEEKEAKKGFLSRWFGSWNKKLAPCSKRRGLFYFVAMNLAQTALKKWAETDEVQAIFFYSEIEDWRTILTLLLAVGRPQTLRIYP